MLDNPLFEDRNSQVSRPDEPIRQLRLNRPLHELSPHHVFFTTALMIQAGSFDRDPVAESCAYHNDFESVRAVDLAVDLFDGLGIATLATERGMQAIDFNRRLYVVPAEAWVKFRNTIAGMCWLLEGVLIKTLLMQVIVEDPTVAHNTVAAVQVNVFCPNCQGVVCVLEHVGFGVRLGPVCKQLDNLEQRSLEDIDEDSDQID